MPENKIQVKNQTNEFYVKKIREIAIFHFARKSVKIYVEKIRKLAMVQFSLSCFESWILILPFSFREKNPQNHRVSILKSKYELKCTKTSVKSKGLPVDRPLVCVYSIVREFPTRYNKVHRPVEQ